ncbi:MAG: glycerol-3-phosphate dehydrogenase/oxidase [Candidatus Promineifilaceae bacterium]
MNRQDTLKKIADNPNFSVLIIGGGVNGIGTFRDLALQGVDVLLVEKRDFCSGASAASSHMAHGGVRYLENGEFRLVREAVKERNRLLDNAPHYVRPLPTVIPIFKRLSGLWNAPLKFLNLLNKPSERGTAVIKIGLTLYDAYTGVGGRVPPHKVFDRRESLKRYPQLNPEVVNTARYYDGLIEAPERICVEMISDAEAANPNAHALNYVNVVGANKETVRVLDEVSGESLDIRPSLVINAAGPWIDFANQAMGQSSRFIGGTKGSHIVVDNPPLREAIGDHEFFFENHDGRIVLLCPLLDRVLVGTSDLRIDNPDEAVCTEEEIDYFFGMVDKVFPRIALKREQIVFSFSGVRPLPASDAGSTGQISRDHSTRVQEPNSTISFPTLNLVGGKWTTFRAFSEQVTDQTLTRLEQTRRTNTKKLAIGGGAGYKTALKNLTSWTNRVATETGVSVEIITTLFNRYGTIAQPIAQSIATATEGSTPLTHAPTYYKGEILYCIRQEKALDISDLLLRRTSLAIRGMVTNALIAELGALFSAELGWTSAETQQKITNTTQLLRNQHRMKL